MTEVRKAVNLRRRMRKLRSVEWPLRLTVAVSETLAQLPCGIDDAALKQIITRCEEKL